MLHFRYAGKTVREENKNPFKEFHLLKSVAGSKEQWEKHVILTERWYDSKPRPEIPTETIKNNPEVKASNNLIFLGCFVGCESHRVWQNNFTNKTLMSRFHVDTPQALCLLNQISHLNETQHINRDSYAAYHY